MIILLLYTVDPWWLILPTLSVHLKLTSLMQLRVYKACLVGCRTAAHDSCMFQERRLLSSLRDHEMCFQKSSMTGHSCQSTFGEKKQQELGSLLWRMPEHVWFITLVSMSFCLPLKASLSGMNRIISIHHLFLLTRLQIPLHYHTFFISSLSMLFIFSHYCRARAFPGVFLPTLTYHCSYLFLL